MKSVLAFAALLAVAAPAIAQAPPSDFRCYGPTGTVYTAECRWTGAQRVQLQVGLGKDTAFAHPALDTVLAAPPPVRFPLAEGYLYRARSVDGASPSAWTAYRLFRVFNYVAMPALEAPLAGAAVGAEPVVLRWAFADASARAQVEVATDSAFQAVVVREDVDADRWSRPILAGTYFWRVRAIDANRIDRSVWSETRRVDVLPTWNGAIETPSDHAVLDLRRVFRWTRGTTGRRFRYFLEGVGNATVSAGLWSLPEYGDGVIVMGTDTTTEATSPESRWRFRWTPGRPLPWRVVAYDSLAQRYTASPTVVSTVQQLDTPQIVNVRTGDTLSAPLRTLVWRSVPGAAYGYRVFSPETATSDTTVAIPIAPWGGDSAWTVGALDAWGRYAGAAATVQFSVRIPPLPVRARYAPPTYDRLVLEWDAVPEADGYTLLVKGRGREMRFVTDSLHVDVGKVYSAGSIQSQAGFGPCAACATRPNGYGLGAPFYAGSPPVFRYYPAPGDTSVAVPSASRLAEAWNVPVAPGPARVAWPPVEGASAYHVVMLQYRSAAEGDSVRIDREVSDPEVALDLPANASLSVLVRAVVNGSYGRYDQQYVRTGSSVAAETAAPEGSTVRVLQNPVVDRLAVAYRSASPSRFALYDLLGREVWHADAEAGTGRVEMARGALASGVYVLRAVQGEAVTARTVVLR